MARYDFGLNDEEFGSLTPGEFNALCKRRNVGIKYERYAAALAASAIYNVHRGSSDDPLVEPFDFIRTTEEAEKKELRLKAKKFVHAALTLPFGTTREKYLEVRMKVIADLVAGGYEDGEQIVDTCFPSLRTSNE